MTTQRERQVAAYKARPAVQHRTKVRGRTVAAAAAWVRDEHPDVWAKLMAEAETTVRLEDRNRHG